MGRRSQVIFLFYLNYRNKSQLLGKVIITMTECILQRMAAAVVENETFSK